MKLSLFTQEQIKKSTELLSKIDTDTGSLFNGCVNKDYCNQNFFDDGENAGVFFSLLFYGNLRIFIAFEYDTDKFAHELSELILSSKEKYIDIPVRVWFRNENRKVISSLRQLIKFEPELPNGFHYASHEFVMDREHFKGFVNDKQLEIKPYDGNKLDDFLLLLDNAMTFASPPPNFRGNRENMAEELKKKVFWSFYKGNELIGLYWLDNDFYTIDIMAVSPNYQRHGYGSIILSHAINTVLSDQKYDMAKLYCVDWNAKGLNFYKKFGMITKGHRYLMTVE